MQANVLGLVIAYIQNTCWPTCQESVLSAGQPLSVIDFYVRDWLKRIFILFLDKLIIIICSTVGVASTVLLTASFTLVFYRCRQERKSTLPHLRQRTTRTRNLHVDVERFEGKREDP